MVLSYTPYPPTKEMSMVTTTYTVKVPSLVKRLGLGAMDLVRLTGIAVNSAYQAVDPERCQKTSLDTCWKIYVGLREAGQEIKDNGSVRVIAWHDVVEI